MSNAYTSVFFHCVWGTKKRRPFLISPWDQKIYQIINAVVQNQGGQVLSIGGMPDHIHMCISIKPAESIARLIRCVKSVSSKMIRQAEGRTDYFAWQRGYGAFSVSLSNINAVNKYISNQHKHHNFRSFEEEFKILLQKHNIQFDKDKLFEK